MWLPWSTNGMTFLFIRFSFDCRGEVVVKGVLTLSSSCKRVHDLNHSNFFNRFRSLTFRILHQTKKRWSRKLIWKFSKMILIICVSYVKIALLWLYINSFRTVCNCCFISLTPLAICSWLASNFFSTPFTTAMLYKDKNVKLVWRWFL